MYVSRFLTLPGKVYVTKYFYMSPISNEIGGVYYFAFVRPIVTPFCAYHILRTLFARVLNFYIWVSHEKIADPYFLLVWHICTFRVMPL